MNSNCRTVENSFVSEPDKLDPVTPMSPGTITGSDFSNATDNIFEF